MRADGRDRPQPRTLSNPAASPDGRFLAAVAEPWVDSSSFTPTFRGAIALFDPATGGFLRDLTSAHADGTPAFSPDGRQVAFTRGEDLYVVAVAGWPAQAAAPRRARPDVGAR